MCWCIKAVQLQRVHRTEQTGGPSQPTFPGKKAQGERKSEVGGNINLLSSSYALAF